MEIPFKFFLSIALNTTQLALDSIPISLMQFQ
jgi:hypothetical protein